MDDLQYINMNYAGVEKSASVSFKPCYIWMTFNTLSRNVWNSFETSFGFKPCYIWMTFNTSASSSGTFGGISFKPCYIWMTFNTLQIKHL